MTTSTTSSSISSSRRLQIVLVSAAVAFFWIGMYLYVPTLSIYAQGKVNDLASVGVILSMYGLWQGMVRLPLGILSDWLSRRKLFILLGLGMAGLGAWLMASASGYGGLVAGRAITGVAAAAWVPLTVMFSSLFPPKEAVRATGILSIINAVGCMIGTSLTGTLNDWGGYSLAFYAAVGASGLALLVLLPVTETVKAPKTPSFKRITALITRRDVLLPALLNAVTQYVIFTSVFGFLPILGRDMGASGQLISFLATLYMAVSIAGNFLVIGLRIKVGHRALVLLSFAAFVLGMGSAALANSLAWVVLAQVLVGLGAGLSYPVCMGMSIEHVDESERTTAMGLHQAVYAIGMFTGPWLSGILADAYGIRFMFAATAVGALGLSLLLDQILHRRG